VTLIDKRNECIDLPQSVSGAYQMQSARRCDAHSTSETVEILCRRGGQGDTVSV
jgi:hypothetical protein